jgi:hypothetical protein
LHIIRFNPKVARSGMTMLMVSTTGEQYAFYRLDEDLRPIEVELPEALRESVERISENCEPALLFKGLLSVELEKAGERP